MLRQAARTLNTSSVCWAAGSKDAKHKHVSYTPEQCVPALKSIYEEESRVNWTSVGILVASWLIIAGILHVYLHTHTQPHAHTSIGILVYSVAHRCRCARLLSLSRSSLSLVFRSLSRSLARARALSPSASLSRALSGSLSLSLPLAIPPYLPLSL